MDSDPGTIFAPRQLNSARRVLTRLLILCTLLVAVGWLVHDDQGRPIVRAIVEDYSEQRGIRLVGERWSAIFEAAKKEDLDPSLVAGIMWSESRGVSGRVSSVGALGLMQLVLTAANDAAERLGLEAPDRDTLLHDDALNLALGCNHLAWLRDSTPEWNAEALLVAYNTGRGRLLEWSQEAGSYQLWVASQETRHAAGRSMSPALIYARETLRVRNAFREQFAGDQ